MATQPSTVKELISRLSMMNQDAPVFVAINGNGSVIQKPFQAHMSVGYAQHPDFDKEVVEIWAAYS